MKVTLLAHTSISEEFYFSLPALHNSGSINYTDGQAVALTAIRTCYSANKPSEIVSLEGGKYFGSKATDGKEGTEADRLIRHVLGSKHLSTVEHLNFTFAIEGVSRALLAQLTRHRVGFAYSVQSQRYVKFSSDSKSGGFDYVVPEKVKANPLVSNAYEEMMDTIQGMYDSLVKWGIPQEDARSVLPQSATCNLVLTVNLRALLDFFNKRGRKNSGAQAEISLLANELKDKVCQVEPWVEPFFGGESK